MPRSRPAKAPRVTGPERLLWRRRNGWPHLPAAEAETLAAYAADYRAFLSVAKTERAANTRARALAAAAGYVPAADLLRRGTPLAPGAKLFLDLRGKTLVLVHVGRQPLSAGLRIVGAHTDSPRLDLKPRPLYEEGGMALLDTHYYGGVKKYQWVSWPLALHGVVVLKSGECREICIGEAADDPVFTITDLLPHLGKDQGEKKLSEAIAGEGLNLLCGSQPVDAKDGGDRVKLNVLKLLHAAYGIDEADLASAELEVVPAGPTRELGFDRSMLLGYGHDDRACAYAALRALLDLAATPEHTAVCILCDKEEIGSYGATGMSGQFFENFVVELVTAQREAQPEAAWRRALRQSRMLSADVNALHDPNYPEVSSPNDNMAKLNHGLIVSKYGGARGKSGSNDADAEYLAWLRAQFDAAGVVWQIGELGKVDQGGGGTIAYMLARYEMDVVDCGPGLLSMHAPWEVAGKFDLYMTYKGYRTFYQAP